ncbi:MAG: lamin tail domain-containing protein, partial [Rhizobiales bacterium]|nr:lamin tail domain-containing protein [Rhizobacter sp.]
MAKSLVSVALGVAATAHADSNIQITEWLYDGRNGEYIEFTNLGTSAVDFNGWSFDDDSSTPGVTSLSGFGIVAAGQSVVLTEAAAADFRSAWGLAAAVKVVGDNTNNLGRNDQINLFNAGGMLVDRFTYGDQSFTGTIRTQYRSGNPLALADLTPQTVTNRWVFASTGDAYGSRSSTLGDIGNPGSFALTIPAPVPEPSAYALTLIGFAGVAAL